MKKNKTYELTGALMNLYKKLNKIEKHCSDAEKVRIYSGIAAVMPDELSEIKRVIDRAQNPYSVFNLFNNTTQMSNYMMNVNAAEKAIDDMNAIAQLFNFMRKKNNLPNDIDMPMFMIGELKSAFEKHDFELFEKISISHEYDIGKMVEEYPDDDAFNNTSTESTKDEEPNISSDDNAVEPEKVAEPQNVNLIQRLTFINDKVDESKIKEIDGDFLRSLGPEDREHWLEYSKTHITEAVDILKVKLDKHTAIALWKDIVELSKHNSYMTTAYKLFTKHKLNISPAVIYNTEMFINDKTRTGSNIVPWEGLLALDIILDKDGYNQFENDNDIVIEPKMIPHTILEYICKMIFACKFKSEIITNVKKKFKYDVNLWDIGVISYQLVANNGEFINDEGLIKYYIIKPWVSLRMTDKDGKRIPVSQLVVESVENEQETIACPKKEVEEESADKPEERKGCLIYGINI